MTRSNMYKRGLTSRQVIIIHLEEKICENQTMNIKIVKCYILTISIIIFYLGVIENVYAKNIEKPPTFYFILSQNGTHALGPSPSISNNTIFIGDYSGILSAIDQNTAQVKWRYRTYDTEYGLSTVIFDKDSIYFTAGSRNPLYRTLYSLSKSAGKEQWKIEWANDGDFTPIVIDNNLIYYASKYEVAAVNKYTGTEEWNFFDEAMHFSTAVVYEDNLIFGSKETYHNNGHGIYSLDKITGQLKWTFDGEHKANNNSTLKEGFANSSCIMNGNIYVAGSFGNLYAIDANTGTLKWKHKYESNSPQDSAVCYNDTVYVGTKVEYDKGALYAIDAHTGTLKWKYNANDRVYTPHVNNDSIYFGTAEHDPWYETNPFLYALDTQGKLKWKFKTDGFIVTAPITNRGVVYFETLAGSLYAIDEETGTL